ncbi:reactive intermediate/imine deaminase [Planctomycetota bacterium]|jgi:2-iminobutanoate/2-iminopropanoate deaminase|nr:RidA family protein [Planctomycetota bacterium]MSR40082.1 RidA family protein [Planctomycetota bacterium]GDY01693.1 reactive intermediate/imine deaminase [Planctomycetota bacterium]
MKPEIVQTDAAPKAIGPYSQAVKFGNVVYCSGQISLDPATNQMVGATVAEQTERVMQNLSAVLSAAGSGFDRVLRCSIFLVSIGDFAAVNEVYGKRFTTHKPARATIAVKELPKGALVEIDCTAAI